MYKFPEGIVKWPNPLVFEADLLWAYELFQLLKLVQEHLLSVKPIYTKQDLQSL